MTYFSGLKRKPGITIERLNESFFQARVNGECVGAIVCKLDYHKKIVKRGYIAMLAVDSGHRKRKIGSTLVKRAIDAMIAEEADEVKYISLG